jgi:hypothetical protein
MNDVHGCRKNKITIKELEISNIFGGSFPSEEIKKVLVGNFLAMHTSSLIYLSEHSNVTKMNVQKFKILLFPLTLVVCSSRWAKTNFSCQTIDSGVVVTDAKKFFAFYKDVIGFHEVPSFKVNSKFPKAIGLTDGSHLNVHVLVKSRRPS